MATQMDSKIRASFIFNSINIKLKKLDLNQHRQIDEILLNYYKKVNVKKYSCAIEKDEATVTFHWPATNLFILLISVPLGVPPSISLLASIESFVCFHPKLSYTGCRI
jgi:hypothetical protein